MMVLMCCGCQKFLKADGSLQAMTGGIVQVSGRDIRTAANDSESDTLANFVSVEEADLRALSLGWQTADASGANHRCPACVAKEREEVRQRAEHAPPDYRGAYVRFADGKPVEILP